MWQKATAKSNKHYKRKWGLFLLFVMTNGAKRQIIQQVFEIY